LKATAAGKTRPVGARQMRCDRIKNNDQFFASILKYENILPIPNKQARKNIASKKLLLLTDIVAPNADRNITCLDQ
jgi:hypothetical protein